MEDDVFVVEADDPDLQQGAVACRPDQHGHVVFVDLADGVADRVVDVVVGDSVLPCRLVDPHLDNLPCLERGVKNRGLRGNGRPSVDRRVDLVPPSHCQRQLRRSQGGPLEKKAGHFRQVSESRRGDSNPRPLHYE